MYKAAKAIQTMMDTTNHGQRWRQMDQISRKVSLCIVCICAEAEVFFTADSFMTDIYLARRIITEVATEVREVTMDIQKDGVKALLPITVESRRRFLLGVT